MNTDGNMDAIERHLADCEEHDAWQDLQDQLEAARADAKEAEAYAEELEREVARLRLLVPRPEQTQMAALVEAAEKVINSYWHSTDGVITGIYDLEASIARVKGETK